MNDAVVREGVATLRPAVMVMVRAWLAHWAVTASQLRHVKL